MPRRIKLNPAERQKYAQQDFDYWFDSAVMFYENYEINYKNGLDKKSIAKLVTNRFSTI